MQEAWEISLQQVRLGYGEHVVVDNLTATLPKGKISVILGGSGCGKSTLLKHITGLLKPLAGSIQIAGQDLSTLAPKDRVRLRRRLGVLFQDGALLGALTLEENVALPLSEHLHLKRETLKAEALRVLRMVELENFATFYPHELSGGMRKRAGLARAIIANPKVLLCDEPTSGLDPITAAHMDDLLLALHRLYPKMTMVVVSHDLASLARIAQFVLVLGQGRCLFQGSLQDLENTQDPYLREFLERRAQDREFTDLQAIDPCVQKALEAWLNS
ncbi:MAG: ATP-binding cassette domain-containing protein [Desulfovibrionaceae bacterium]|nr:ATP-binding cassette domain-containing protein [Desulfovibrionaceae bacterium]